MKVLILSSNNGGGHNAVAKAIAQCFKAHGDECTVRDCLSYVSDHASELVSRSHDFMYRLTPELFGSGYRRTEGNPEAFKEHRRIRQMIELGQFGLGKEIREEGFELVICTHVFAAIMLTAAKKRYQLPVQTALVETDYTNTPGSAENQVDVHFLPDASLIPDLMAAGVPIKSMVAGISCGLVTGETDDDYLILTDIQGLEDFFGDMDFKVAGTHKGITAIQMDIKIHGLTRAIIEEAISRAREARFYIMDEVMSKAIAAPRPEVGKYAPKIDMMMIDPEKIGDVVGKQGKVINKIIADTGVKIDITDDGLVSICGTDPEMMAKAKKTIEIIVTEFEEGQILDGTVVSIKDFGAFLEFAPGKEGMVHISRLSDRRVEKVEDVLSLGQNVRVVCLGKDKMGRFSFSIKDLKDYE